MAGQVAAHGEETAAARGRNNAKLKNYHRQNKEIDVKANLDNVKYLSDVQEQDFQQDRTYQAMLDQWSDTDAQLQSLFATADFKIEEAIVAMHTDSYAGTQTGATAARRAGASAMELGRKKTRILHDKMMAVDDANRAKDKTWKGGKHDSNKLFMDVAFAPVHGFRPAVPEMEAGPSKAGLILGLAGTGFETLKTGMSNKAKKTSKWCEKDSVGGSDWYKK